jgi:hypothetical protein
MQNLGRRVGRWLDATFSPHRVQDRAPAAEIALAGGTQAATE